MESIIAVPLVWCKVPVYYALPVVSTFIAVFPFVFISVILYRKEYVIHAFFFLLLVITLPTEYDILTSITRGFTSGIFFTGFLIFPLLEPHSRKSFWLYGLFASIGYVINPNSVIFSFPIGLYLFFENIRDLRFYLLVVVSSLPAFTALYFAKQFYENRPDYIVHSMWKLEFSFSVMGDALSHLDKFFRYLTPALWSGNWLVLVVILILSFLLIRKNWKKGISLLFTILLIVISLGVNKVNDEIGVLFLCSSRMFLAVPLLLGLAVFWYKPHWKATPNFNLVVFSLASVFFIAKAVTNQSVIDKETKRTSYGAVAIKNLVELKSECNEIGALADQYNAELVVFVPFNVATSSLEFYNYGCPVLEDKPFPTMLSIYERRTHVYQEEYATTRKTLLLFSPDLEDIDRIKKEVDCEVLRTTPAIVLIRNNDKTLVEISKIFKFDFKRNGY